MLKRSVSLIVISILCMSCNAPNGTQQVATLSPSVTPIVATETLQQSPTVAFFTPTLTLTPEYAPTETQTIEPTPTQVVGTPSIIEVTPLGGENAWANAKIEDLNGIFTPYSTMNVRWGPSMDYPVRYRLYAGQNVQVYAWVSELPFEAWLCLDAPISTTIGTLCSEAVALTIDHKEYGKLVIDE